MRKKLVVFRHDKNCTVGYLLSFQRKIGYKVGDFKKTDIFSFDS